MRSSFARAPEIPTTRLPADLRLIFAGTPEFAARALAGLLDAGHEIPLVLTQPDRPAGRGLRPMPSAVKSLATARGIEVFQPTTLKDEAVVARLAGVRADAMVVAAYGLILPAQVLGIARHGALNIHASLLPRWRGAAPIQRAILAGDRESGISIMQMDEGLDTGPVLSRRVVAIADDDDSGSLHDKLAFAGAQAIVAALADIAGGRASALAQSAEGVSYARKISKEEAELDWAQDSDAVDRVIRAMRPSPGARTHLRGEAIKLWRAKRIADANAAPGTVLGVDADGIRVACGVGGLLVTELQRAGGRRLPAIEFLRGFPLSAGERLGPAR